MARKENITKKENAADIVAGLSFGGSQNEQEIPQQNAPVPEVPKQVQQPAAQPEMKEVEGSQANKGLAQIYAAKLQQAPEARSVRIQAVVTPSTAQKLDEAVSKGKIKSRNDLINFLLEGYLKTFE